MGWGDTFTNGRLGDRSRYGHASVSRRHLPEDPKRPGGGFTHANVRVTVMDM